MTWILVCPVLLLLTKTIKNSFHLIKWSKNLKKNRNIAFKY